MAEMSNVTSEFEMSSEASAFWCYLPGTDLLGISSRTLHSCLGQFYHVKCPLISVSTQLVFPRCILMPPLKRGKENGN